MKCVAGARGLALVLAATALLRVPAFAWGVISDDEAIYEAMGRRIADGGVMYRDTVDHKPPGLAYTYAACRRLAGPGAGATVRAMRVVHAVGLVTVCATSALLFLVVRRLRRGRGQAVDGSHDHAVALWAAALYGVVSAAKQPVDGLAVNGELLMNLPLCAGALLALMASDVRSGGALRPALLDVAVGALCAVAALCKYQALLLGVALPLLPLAQPGDVRQRLRALLPRALCWLLGAAAPFALVALYFDHRGVLDQAIFWGLRFNRDYLREGAGFAWALERLSLQLGGVVAPGLLLYGGAAVGLLALLRPSSPRSFDLGGGGAFVVGWALLSAAAVTLGGRYFGHYFLQAEPPLSLVAAPVVARLFTRRPVVTIGALAVPALGFALVAAQPALSSSLFNAGDPDFATIGRATAAATAPEDAIWVWGNVPQIYYFADRTPGARFTFCNYLSGLSPATPSEYDPRFDPRRDRVPGALELAVADLAARRPALVLDTAENGLKHYGRFPIRDFPALADHLAAHYLRGETVAGVVFYRLRR